MITSATSSGSSSGTRQPDRVRTPADGERGGSAQAEKRRSEEEGASQLGVPRSASGKPLSVAEQQIVRELQARDREVRAHEAAHQAVGGALTGGASYSYQTGPDGKRYAVGGEVSVLISTADDPNETIARMAQVRAAALAPANPSGQDRSVAAAAAAISARAQQELVKLQREQQAGGEERPGSRFDATA